jgi:hypothetical protein
MGAGDGFGRVHDSVQKGGAVLIAFLKKWRFFIGKLR